MIATYPTGREPQHVVPSWDEETLWVNDDLGNDVVPINPITGTPGKPVPARRSLHLYFTADSGHALVMAGGMHRIDAHPRVAGSPGFRQGLPGSRLGRLRRLRLRHLWLQPRERGWVVGRG